MASANVTKLPETRVHQPHHFVETARKISAGIFGDCNYAGAIELYFNTSGMDGEEIRQE